jgi:hypothetical protein
MFCLLGVVQDLLSNTADNVEEKAPPDETAFTLESVAASSVDSVGTSDPVNDFKALLQAGKADTAFHSLPQAVYSLVSNSLGNR